MKRCTSYEDFISLPNPITQVADMPYALYLSLQGKYFVGYADNINFGNGSIAWAGLVNPFDSGVNLFIHVWTVTNIGKSPLTAKAWLNTAPPGTPVESQFLTPANTALRPLPVPKVKLLQASNVNGSPKGGINISENQVEPEVTIVGDEQGILIFPPGGSFIITLSNPETQHGNGEGRVAFGWAEEELKNNGRGV